VENHDSFGPDFWVKIAHWQLLEYQRDARKLLEDYDKHVSMLEKVEPITRLYRAALAKAVERAQAESPLNGYDVTWSDVFIIRHLSYDPDLKGVIHNSDVTSLEGRQKLMRLIDELLLDEPHFPPECYSLKFK
ncbi:hypothetical protein FRC01_005212, partial [Tulasnella sp. 417]